MTVPDILRADSKLYSENNRILQSKVTEGVSELLMCYPLWMSERNRAAGEIASNDDYASSALSLLPRHGYRATWYHTRREATVSMPDMPDSRADISFGVCVRRAIA